QAGASAAAGKDFSPVSLTICGACRWFWNRISASLRIGFGGHRCRAEIQPVRHRARAHSPQSVSTQEFRKNVNILTLCIASGSLAKEYAESRQRPGCFLRLYVVKSTFFGEVPHEAT